MNLWDTYPADYRQVEIQALTQAVRAGDCVSLVGLSGAGKSNLLGVLVQRLTAPRPLLVDCNRLEQSTPTALFRQVRARLGEFAQAADEFTALEAALQGWMAANREPLCMVFDRFDVFLDPPNTALFNNLRLLRDSHKYRLTMVLSTRRPLPADNELAELFFAHTLYLGCLAQGDARWSVAGYAARCSQDWDAATMSQVISLSGGYPAFLRAVCEAHAAGAPLELTAMLAAPAVKARLAEFWADHPSESELRSAGLTAIPLLAGQSPASEESTAQTQPLLTAKEQRLLSMLKSHPGQVCEKDDLIRAVWSEDRVFLDGIRDDSLAQLVRRLREKIEINPSDPNHVRTAPGRGYIYRE